MTDLQTLSATLFEPGDLIELRCFKKLPDGKTDIIQFWVRASNVLAMQNTLHGLNQQGYNLSFGPNPRKRRGGKTADVALARCLFCDFDHLQSDDDSGMFNEVLSRIDAAGLPRPTLSVASGHGIHTYWKLDIPIRDAGVFSAAQQRMIELLDSDTVPKDFPRVMRCPGFLNVKSEPHKKSYIIDIQKEGL
jgi:hypothetical protein